MRLPFEQFRRWPPLKLPAGSIWKWTLESALLRMARTKKKGKAEASKVKKTTATKVTQIKGTAKKSGEVPAGDSAINGIIIEAW